MLWIILLKGTVKQERSLYMHVLFVTQIASYKQILNNIFNDQTTCYLISIFVFLQKGLYTSMPPGTFDWVHFLHHICVKKGKSVQFKNITVKS